MTAAPSGPVLFLDSVSQAFGARLALKGVSLELGAGEIYALLGPNGAGKTTLVRVVCGRIRPDEGRARVLGRDPFVDGEARAALGLAPQALALYPQLTVEENLAAFARLAGLRRSEVAGSVERAMAVTDVEARATSLVRELSGGLQRRVNIAAAILSRPRLLVLDEPTAGVDLPGREAVSEALRRLRGEGVAVLMVTHDLEQAAGLADRTGFLREGAKVLEGAPQALISDAFGADMIVEVDVGEAGPGQEPCLAACGLVRAASSGAWVRQHPDGYGLASRLGERLQAQGFLVREVRVRRPTLADLFARISQPGGAQ